MTTMFSLTPGFDQGQVGTSEGGQIWDAQIGLPIGDGSNNVAVGPAGSGSSSSAGTRTRNVLITWVTDWTTFSTSQVVIVSGTEQGEVGTSLSGAGTGAIAVQVGHSHIDSVTNNGPDAFNMPPMTDAEQTSAWSGPVQYTASSNDGGAPTGTWTLSFVANLNANDPTGSFGFDWNAQLTFNTIEITINSDIRFVNGNPTGVTIRDLARPAGDQILYQKSDFGVTNSIDSANWTTTIPATSQVRLQYTSTVVSGPSQFVPAGQTVSQSIGAGFSFKVTPHE